MINIKTKKNLTELVRIGMSFLAQPIKIVHLIGQLIPGGVELRTLELIENSKSDRFKHYVVVTSGKVGTLDDRYRKAGASIYYLRIGSIKFLYNFWQLLHREKFDVVHSNIMYMSGYILSIARMAGIPRRIAHFQSDGKNGAAMSIRGKVRKSLLKGLIDLNATDIVGLTPANLNLAWSVNWRKDSRCVVVANGVDPKKFSDVSSSVDIPNREQITILHVGRGDLVTKNREKAILVLANIVRRNQQNVELVFVGRNGLTEEISRKNIDRWKALAEKEGILDRVKFLGERSDIEALMAGADVFLFTSTLEGLPGVILEARASGLPIVSTDLPGVRFVAEYFDDLVLLSPDASDEDWGNKVLESLGRNPSERRALQAEFLGSRFDFKVALKEYEMLWEGRELVYGF